MKRMVDDHCFTVEIPHTSGPHCCRIQVFVDDDGDRRPTVVATQDVPPATGRSLTNAAERFAQEAWWQHLRQHAEPPRWIQHYTSGAGAWMEVFFELDSDGRLISPKWTGINADELAEFIGSRIDPGRGSRYVAPPPEPVRPSTFRLVPVAALPATRPFRAKECMPTVGTAGRRLWRRWFPVRSKSCCWYHGGDWREVVDAVTAVLGPVDELELFDEDRNRLLNRLLELTPSGSWLQQASASLLQDPICVDGTGWVNGQHRGQAAIDAGARQILVES